VFGIGLGEIVLILLAIFLVAPREIPAVLKKVGLFFRELDKLKQELFSMKSELEELVTDDKQAVKGKEAPLRDSSQPKSQ
jgi:Sec-independent protein translocase protein TatA